jgi:hypothetical protein
MPPRLGRRLRMAMPSVGSSHQPSLPEGIAMPKLRILLAVVALHFAATLGVIYLSIANLGATSPHGGGAAGRVLEAAVYVLGLPLADAVFASGAFPWFGPTWEGALLLAANSLLAALAIVAIVPYLRGRMARWSALGSAAALA